MARIFRVQDYTTRVYGTDWRWWRGYRIKPSRDIKINKVMFSFSGADAYVALYTMNGLVPSSVIRSWFLPSNTSTVGGVRTIILRDTDPDVVFMAGEYYTIAAGVTINDFVFQRYSVDVWDVTSMIPNEEFLSEWYPQTTEDDDYLSLTWNSGGWGYNLPPSILIGKTPSDNVEGRIHARPDFGLEYEYVDGVTAKVSSSYREVDDGWAKVGGVWRKLEERWTKVGGVWRVG